MSDIRSVNGLLFIGDPHLSSRRPGRRKDADFPKTVLSKIEHLIGVANERRLLPVFLGDMFDAPVEEDERLKVWLLRVLMKSWTTPIANVGNHDMSNVVLGDSDSLMYLAESGALKLCIHSGAVETVKIGEKIVGIGATPYGQSFPIDARPLFSDVDQIIWLTHHDIAFEGAYPGATAPHAIAGCKLVVNGHMHLRKNVLKVGSTVWFNPGNITRQAIDAIDHQPAAFALTEAGKLEMIAIPHEKAIFDLTGKLVSAISPGEIPKEEDNPLESAFVDMLKADNSMEMDRTDDGSVLLEEIEEKFQAENTSEDVRGIVLSLHGKAIG